MAKVTTKHKKHTYNESRMTGHDGLSLACSSELWLKVWVDPSGFFWFQIVPCQYAVSGWLDF